MTEADLDFIEAFDKCTFNNVPDIDTPIANMKSWSGQEIADIANLRDRRIYLQTGSADITIGPNVMWQLKRQLENFVDPEKIIYVTTTSAAHTFPADFDGSGDNDCDKSESPYVSNCDYDGAGAVLKWLYGDLNSRNTRLLSGNLFRSLKQVLTVPREWTILPICMCPRRVRALRLCVGCTLFCTGVLRGMV